MRIAIPVLAFELNASFQPTMIYFLGLRREDLNHYQQFLKYHSFSVANTTVENVYSIL